MLSKKFDFSGITILVRSEQELSVNEKLCPFETDTGKTDFTVNVRYSDTIPEIVDDSADSFILSNSKMVREPESPYARVDYFGNECNITILNIYREAFDFSGIFKLIRLPHILVKFDAFILHAAYIVVDGEAILFSAPSGTGKSTQAELWKKYRNARIINGDRVLIRRSENGFTAGGIYYSGASNDCNNITVPLRAIVLLSQAKQNTVEKCGGAEALRRMFRECAYINISDDASETAEIIADVINRVDILKLECLPDVSAVETLEDYLFGGKS